MTQDRRHRLPHPRGWDRLLDGTWVVLADRPTPECGKRIPELHPDAEVQAKETMTNQYATCSSAAKTFIDPKMLADPAIFVPDDVLAKLEGQKDNSGIKQRAEIYEEFKTKIGQG